MRARHQQHTTGPNPHQGAALDVRELTKVHGRGPAAVHGLRGVDLSVAAGAFVAVMGPSGSGKSTLLGCIAGVDRPTGGTILIEGHDTAAWSEDHRTAFRRDRLGMVYQDLQLVPYLTAEENVALPGLLAGAPLSTLAIHAALEQVGMRDEAGRLPSALSGGQCQRVAIARALAIGPALILADEPTGALDLRTARQVLDLLRAVVDGPQQATVVMVTHDPAVAAYADEVVFLADGRIVRRMVAPSTDAVAAHMAHLDRAVCAEVA